MRLDARLAMRLPSLILHCLSVFSLVCFFSPTVWSQTTDGDLLSYSELMRLPQEKRVAYIEGVRKILVELSKDPEARFSDSDPRARSKLKSWLEFINQNFASEALADEAITAKAQDRQLCLTSNQCKSALRSCFDQGQGIIWQEEVGTYRCNPANQVGSKSQSSGSAVFAPVYERAFLQYAESISDPRGKTEPSNGTTKAPPLADAAIAASSADASGAAIAIVRPVRLIKPPAESSSPASVLQAAGVPSSPKFPGSQARSIQEYVKLLAQGKIKGKRYTCRSKHLNESFKNDKGEVVDHSNFPECTDEQEGKIQTLFDRANAVKLSLLTDASPTADPAATGDAQGITTFPVPPAAPLTSVFGKRITRTEIQPYLDERKSPDEICEGERKDLGPGKLVFVPMADDGSFGRCMSDTNAKLFLAGGIERHPSDSVQPEQPTRLPARQPAVGAAAAAQSALLTKFPACAPKLESCGDRDAIKKSYYQGKLPCVFAGMISNLDGQNRRCQAITEYKVGNENLKCEAGQAMCNPLLFGTVLGSSPTKAICVGRGQDVTSQCGKLSNARDAELFINRNAIGLQEKWNEFKTNLESVCKSETASAKFHCQECNTMKQRLFELHARLVGNPCETSLDQGIQTRIKSRSRATEK
jgi:hypothetical protein